MFVPLPYSRAVVRLAPRQICSPLPSGVDKRGDGCAASLVCVYPSRRGWLRRVVCVCVAPLWADRG